MLRHTTLCAFVVFMMVMGAAYAQGRRSDTCGDHWGSNAWGLCNAYCEAKDCDSTSPKGSETSCTQIYENFMEVAGEGETMPCEITPPASPQSTGGCPCNFNVQSWTALSQILPTNLPMCGEAPCFMCQVSLIDGPTTFLSVLVNLLDGASAQEDKLLFLTTAPSTGEGTCFSNSSFTSEVPIPTEGGPLTFDHYSACVSDIGDLKDAYTSMCNPSP